MQRSATSGVVKIVGVAACASILAWGALASASQAPGSYSHRSGAQAGLSAQSLAIAHREAHAKPYRVVMKPQASLRLLSHATMIGPHAAHSKIKLEFGLRLRHVTRLKQFLQQVQYPESPVYHHWLTPQEFTRLYGPTRAQVASVKNFLNAHGIRVLKVSANHELIFTEATTATYEHALSIRINDYKMDGRTFYSTKDSPRIPRAIAPLVLSVMGLNHGAQLRPMIRPGTVHPAKTVRAEQVPPPNPSQYLSQDQFAVAYNWPDVHDTSNGAGETIAIIGFRSRNYDVSSAHTYWQEMGVPDHNVTIDKVNGTPGTGAEAETALDIEFSGYMAPGADIIFTKASLSTPVWPIPTTRSSHRTSPP